MTQPLLTLNDARKLPQLGFGVFKVPQDEATETVTLAIQSGYKAIDTAASTATRKASAPPWPRPTGTVP